MNKKEVIEYMIQSGIEIAKEFNAVLDHFEEIAHTAVGALDRLTVSEREEVNKDVSDNTAEETRETLNALIRAALARKMDLVIDAASIEADAETLDKIMDILEEAEKKKCWEIKKQMFERRDRLMLDKKTLADHIKRRMETLENNHKILEEKIKARYAGRVIDGFPATLVFDDILRLYGFEQRFGELFILLEYIVDMDAQQTTI